MTHKYIPQEQAAASAFLFFRKTGKTIGQNCPKVLQLKNEPECYDVCQDLCTVSELRSMEQRFAVASLLNDGMIYSDILEHTGASSATISRVNRSLSYGTGGYARVFERLKAAKEQEAKPE